MTNQPDQPNCCPNCGATELHPNDPNMLLVRFYKVHSQGRWWSQCLVCAGYFDTDLNPKPPGTDGINPDYDRNLGWF